MYKTNLDAPERFCSACWRPFHSTRPRRLCWSCARAKRISSFGAPRPVVRSMADALALIERQLQDATGTEAMLLELTRDALLCLRDQPPLRRVAV